MEFWLSHGVSSSLVSQPQSVHMESWPKAIELSNVPKVYHDLRKVFKNYIWDSLAAGIIWASSSCRKK